MRQLVRLVLFLGAIFGCLAFAPTAKAGPRDFLVCIPGSAGSSAGATTYMNPFFRRVESLARWPVSSISGSYQPSYGGCLTHITANRPGFAVMALGAYLEQRKRFRLKVIGQVDMFAGAGKRLYLVVKKGTFRTIADLKGKRLTSNHLAEGTFLNKVLFGGKINVSRHFALRQVNATTKGMRDVARGRAEATIVNDDELKTMQRRSWGQQLEVIHKSPPLPGAPLVAFGGTAKAADIAKLRRVIANMCTGSQGRKLCASTGIRSIGGATDATYARMARRF